MASFLLLVVSVNINQKNSKDMTPQDLRPDRQILSTDNNEYAEGLNDENLWEEDIVDTDVSEDDDIGDYFADPDQKKRPLYDENGFDEDRIEP